MNAILRALAKLALALSFAVATPACMPDRPEIGSYPAADDPGIEAEISKEEASAIAHLALEGLNEGDYAKWTHRWDTSLTDVIDEEAFQKQVHEPVLETYGKFQSIVSTRLTEGEDPKYVRFLHLVQHEKSQIVLVHVYPKDGDKIFGVHLREPTGDDPNFD